MKNILFRLLAAAFVAVSAEAFAEQISVSVTNTAAPVAPDYFNGWIQDACENNVRDRDSFPAYYTPFDTTSHIEYAVTSGTYSGVWNGNADQPGEYGNQTGSYGDFVVSISSTATAIHGSAVVITATSSSGLFHGTIDMNNVATYNFPYYIGSWQGPNGQVVWGGSQAPMSNPANTMQIIPRFSDFPGLTTSIDASAADGTTIEDKLRTTLLSITKPEIETVTVTVYGWDDANQVRTSEVLYSGTTEFTWMPAVPYIASCQGGSVYRDDAASLSVTATGKADLPLTYQWYKSDGSIVTGGTTANLSFASAQDADAGDYYVVATNALASATSGSINLVVNQPPAPVVLSTSATILSDSSIEVSASIDGQGRAAQAVLRWSLTGGDINSYNATAAQAVSGTGAMSFSLTGLPAKTRVYFFVAATSDGGETDGPDGSVETLPVPNELTVTSGSGGNISRGFAGETFRIDGKHYVITATPEKGFVFDGWYDDQGNLVSWNPRLSFVMEDGLVYQARFVPNPFPAIAGSYRGSVSLGGTATGILALHLSSLGSWSARVTTQTNSFAVTGRFTPEGNVLSESKTGVDSGLDLRLDLSGQGVSGTLGDGSALQSDRLVWNARRNPAPQAGKYQYVLHCDEPELGTVKLSVGKSGSVAFVAKLPSGMRVSQSGFVTADGGFYLFVRTNRKGNGFLGHVAGDVTFEPPSASGTLWALSPSEEETLSFSP